jgi:hypothetical protein
MTDLQIQQAAEQQCKNNSPTHTAGWVRGAKYHRTNDQTLIKLKELRDEYNRLAYETLSITKRDLCFEFARQLNNIINEKK